MKGLLCFYFPGPHLIHINSLIYTFSCIFLLHKKKKGPNENRDRCSGVIKLGEGSLLKLLSKKKCFMFTESWHFRGCMNLFVDPREKNCRFAAAKAGPNKWNEMISCIFWIRVFNIYRHIYVSKNGCIAFRNETKYFSWQLLFCAIDLLCHKYIVGGISDLNWAYWM